MADIQPVEVSTSSAHERRLATLSEHFDRLSGTGLQKHMHLRMAILEAIRQGDLKPGDQIPPEQELGVAVGLSLGTVQRALGRLATDRTLVRHHGRGTFVAEARRPVDELWQFRFRTPEGEGPLAVYSRILAQETLKGDGPWREALGADAAGYLRITRTLNIDDRFRCFSHLIVGLTRFAGLTRAFPRDLENVNIKRILAEKFNAPTLAVRQKVRAERLADEVADHLSLPHGTSGLRVDVTGLSYGNEPISYQQIWVPPTDCYLDMTHEESATRAGGASWAKGQYQEPR